MKKIVLLFALMLASVASFAQTADELIGKMKAIKGVEAITFPKAMLDMALSQVDDKDAKKVLKNVDNVSILSLENPSEEALVMLRSGINELAGRGYETMVDTQEDDEATSILVKADGDKIVEAVIVSEEKDEISLIVIKGKLTKSDLGKLQNQLI